MSLMMTEEIIPVSPQAQKMELLLTALSPISHHDPAVRGDSNILTFNRQKQVIRREHSTCDIGQVELDAIAQANPATEELWGLLQTLSTPEILAVSMMRLFYDMYNSAEGEGLFKGFPDDRAKMLSGRAKAAAIRSFNLRHFWDRLVTDMMVTINNDRYDDALLLFFKLPKGMHISVLSILGRNIPSVISIARTWSRAQKHTIVEYADKIGADRQEAFVMPLTFDAAGSCSSTQIIEVPAISSNTIRHQCVRYPGWQHLAGMLGIAEGLPGKNLLPIGVESIFVNGGNISSGSKQPSSPHFLGCKVRENYPLLDLLGGVTDSFDIGESKLAVSSWLVCSENSAAIPDSLSANKSISAFDLLDNVTHTRQATERGAGQMIYEFETLCPGTQNLARFVLKPYTRRLTIGALVAAVETYLSNQGVIAGQSARGFGVVSGEWVSGIEGASDARAEYEEYLRDNAAQLREWLIDGTLGTGSVLFK